MKTMPAGQFKARCLRVMEEVKKYRTPVVITKKGKPVAKLVPVDAEGDNQIFGCGIGTGKIVGDVEAPVFPPNAWNAMRGKFW
jgi:prevent-host-death family protein